MTRARVQNQKAILNRMRVHRCRYRKKIVERTMNFDLENTQQSQSNESNEAPTRKTTRDLLRSWVNVNRVSMAAVNDLLKILNNAGLFTIRILLLNRMVFQERLTMF